MEKRLVTSVFSICFGIMDGFITLNGLNNSLFAKDAKTQMIQGVGNWEK